MKMRNVIMKESSKKVIVFVILLCFSVMRAQELPKIKIQANKVLALVEYVKTISSSRQGILKEHFKKSDFYTEKSKKLLQEFNQLDLHYDFKFQGYPNSRRNGKNMLDVFTIMASNVSDLQELKQNSVGLFQLSEHQKLFFILEEFEPIYDSLFWNKNLKTINKKVEDLRNFKAKFQLDELYQKIQKLYNSSWQSDLPLIISVVPYPVKTGFTATPKDNIIVTGLPLDLDYYEVYFGVVLHEISHILYKLQSKEFQQKIEDWFLQSNSKYKTFAYNWFNETMATAVGNGWVYKNLKGEIDKTNWYNNFYINANAKAIYPLVETYLNEAKSIDKPFIDSVIKVYEENFKETTYNYDNVLTFSTIMIDVEDEGGKLESSVMNTLFSKFHIRSLEIQTPFTCGDKLNDFKNKIQTQIVLTVEENTSLDELYVLFPFLKHENINLDKDFILNLEKDNGQVFILINLKDRNKLSKVVEVLDKNRKVDIRKEKILFF